MKAAVRARTIVAATGELMSSLRLLGLRPADTIWLIAFAMHELIELSAMRLFEDELDEFFEILRRRIELIHTHGVMDALCSIDAAEKAWNDTHGPGAEPVKPDAWPAPKGKA